MAGLTLLVDGDSCPVKEEIYKVGLRHGIGIKIVSNDFLRVPDNPMIELVIVDDKFDAADDAIVELAGANAIVVTSDILLAKRCLETQAVVLAPNGKPFTDDNIGSAIAVRAIMADLRSDGRPMGAGRPFGKKDRSNFLQALDQAAVKLKNRARTAGAESG